LMETKAKPKAGLASSEVTGPSPIESAFVRSAAEGRAALVPYVCAGYPSRAASLDLLKAAADAGADVIELGIPFSDPLADGPTIQRATFAALGSGMTLEGSLRILDDFRSTWQTPVVLMTYLNPVHHFGVEAFLEAAGNAGAQGLLVTDLPVGADVALEARLGAGGLDLIRLVAPTTLPSRVPEIAKGASGFLYYISRTGVTGTRNQLREGLAREIRALRERVTLPIAVGFGISTPAQAAVVAEVADGVVVGSALVEAVERGGVEGAAEFLASLRTAMDRASG
jgi:tryptophan synthase alpha chain